MFIAMVTQQNKYCCVDCIEVVYVCSQGSDWLEVEGQLFELHEIVLGACVP